MLMEIDIAGEVVFKCNICNNLLNVHEDQSTIWIEPCTACEDSAYNEGHNDGQADGYADGYDDGHADGYGEGKDNS